MTFPEDLRYSEEHEWVRLDGDRAVVGITDYAQDALGDVVFVAPPEVGALVVRGTKVCEVESTKSVSDIFAPLSGEIVEVNEALVDAPERLNAEPYGGGWIFSLRVDDGDGPDGLMDADAYRAFVEA